MSSHLARTKIISAALAITAGAAIAVAIPSGPAVASFSTASFMTPDIKVIQYIHPFAARQCARDLFAQGFSKPTAIAACTFLSVSANPLPPPRFPDDQTWTAFVDSKEYRGYVHIPPLTVSCSGGRVTAIDHMPVSGPGTGIHGLDLPGFDHNLGYTPGRPLNDAEYDPGEPFFIDAGGSELPLLMNREGVSEIDLRGGKALITYTTASRIATLERIAAFGLLHFDAPYVWTVTQLRVDCAGHESVSIANSEFPTTNLYINGQLVSFYRQTDLPQFIKEGRRTLNPLGTGYLALAPTCGTDVHWGTKALLGQPVPGTPPVSCFVDILAGQFGGKTGLYL